MKSAVVRPQVRTLGPQRASERGMDMSDTKTGRRPMLRSGRLCRGVDRLQVGGSDSSCCPDGSALLEADCQRIVCGVLRRTWATGDGGGRRVHCSRVSWGTRASSETGVSLVVVFKTGNKGKRHTVQRCPEV